MFTLDCPSARAALEACVLMGRPQISLIVHEGRARLHAADDTCALQIQMAGAGDVDLAVAVDARGLHAWLVEPCTTGWLDGRVLRRADRTAIAAAGSAAPSAPARAPGDAVHPQELAAALAAVLAAAPAHTPGMVWLERGGVLLRAGAVTAWAPCPGVHAALVCTVAAARTLERLCARESAPLTLAPGQIHGRRWSLWQTVPPAPTPTLTIPEATWTGCVHAGALEGLGPERLPRRTLTFADDVATVCGEVLDARGVGRAALRVDVSQLVRLARALGPGAIEVAAGRALRLHAGPMWALYEPV